MTSGVVPTMHLLQPKDQIMRPSVDSLCSFRAGVSPILTPSIRCASRPLPSHQTPTSRVLLDQVVEVGLKIKLGVHGVNVDCAGS